MVADEITEWQNRPLDAFYAILYIDALVVKVRDGGAVENKAAYLVTGVDADGFKHVLGIWLGTAEGSRFWAGVLAELRNRGVKDVLFVCCDGLNGLPDAIEATWPKAKVQTCVIHLIRASMKYVSWKDRKKAAAAMRPIYTALNEAAAKELHQLAWRGRKTDARRVAAAIGREVIDAGRGAQSIWVQYCLAVLELGLGNYQAALQCALAVYEDDGPHFGTHVLPEPRRGRRTLRGGWVG